MRKKYVSTLLALSIVSSLGVISGLKSNVKTVKAMDKTVEVCEDLIYSEENYKNEFAKDRVIVSVKKSSEDVCAESIFDGIDMKDVRQIANCKTPGMIGGESDIDPLYLITLNEAGRENVLEAINVLKDNPDVEYAEPDYVVEPAEISDPGYTPNDEYFNRQWNMGKIHAPEAWLLSKGSPDVVVGVIDTGLKTNEPDVWPNVWTNPGEIPGDGIDNDGNGYIDDVHGWNFRDNTNDLDDTYQAHGTHVAGIIGAVGDNGIGVTGVCMNVKMAILRYCTNVGYTSDIISAVQYANAMGIEITNHSHGSAAYSPSLERELEKGGLRICAAGNYGKNTDMYPFYPACYDLDNVISVASTDHRDKIDTGSNYGSWSVDIAAPGVAVYSTVGNGNIVMKSGTSMACPHVTGAAALLQGYRQIYDPAELKLVLFDSADPIEDLVGKTSTGGRLNVFRALDMQKTGC